MSRHKSQVTMLMIVGLVLFIIVSFVLYLSKSSVKKQSQQTIKKTQETAIDTKPIKEFINKCVDKLAKDAVVLLGKQGGYLYASQGGTLLDYSDTDEGIFFVKYNGLNVAYNILPPKFAAPPYSSEIPDYPWKAFPYQKPDSNAESFKGFFGISNLPPLNSSEGPNSIQIQIETFVDHNIAGCADMKLFTSQGYEIEMGASKTYATIGNRNIMVKSEMPVKITNAGTKETTEMKDFSADISVNLRNTYFLIKDLIENDIKDVKFNISNAKDNQGPNIILTRDAFSDDARKIRADLLDVTDENSLVYGKPFQYIFARKNRAPALYYIKKNIFSFPSGYLINESSILQKNPLKAEDPDEDSLAFNIYVGEFGKTIANFPKKLDTPQLKFRVEVSDGQFQDYQMITVNRI